MIKNSVYKLFKICICKRLDQLSIILLIGMNTSLITYPMTPITANPNAHELVILMNSIYIITTFFVRFSALM